MQSVSSSRLRLAFVFFMGLMLPLSVAAQDYSCDRLGDNTQAMLENAGLSTCLFPFGIPVVADSGIPKSYVNTTAAIIAQYLDPERTGRVTMTAVFNKWQERGAWIPMPWDKEDWQKSEEALNETIGYGMIAPRWWMDGELRDNGPTEEQRRVLFEEVTHLYTDQGLSYVYPAAFGVEDYSGSILGRQTKIATCSFWHHPEYDCPDRKAEALGDCDDVSCNATEFLHAVIATLNGVAPQDGVRFDNYGLFLQGQTLRQRLQPAFLTILENPAFGLPITGFAFDYPLELTLQ